MHQPPKKQHHSKATSALKQRYFFNQPKHLLFLAIHIMILTNYIYFASAQNTNIGEDGMVIRAESKLTCWKCAGRRSNNTCIPAFRTKMSKSGLDYRCRVYERNGEVVAQEMVPKMLCTTQAKSMVRPTTALIGSGRIHIGCCNSDLCNSGFCQAEGKDNAACSTKIGWKKTKFTKIGLLKLKSKPGPSTTTKTTTLKTPPTTQLEVETKILENTTLMEDLMQKDGPAPDVEFIDTNEINKEPAKKSASLKAASSEPEAEAKTEPKAEGNGNAVMINQKLFCIILLLVTWLPYLV